jgi:hypothetical protein
MFLLHSLCLLTPPAHVKRVFTLQAMHFAA